MAAGFIFAVFLQNAVFALLNMFLRKVILASFTTKGSHRSDGLIVSQNAAGPNSINNARICNRISSFYAKEFGTCAATVCITCRSMVMAESDVLCVKHCK